jgi:DNA-binding transcriptional MerR regulator
MKNRYLIKEVVEILDIPMPRFKEWKLRKLIKASIREKQGKRTINYYTKKDILGVKLLDYLGRSGFNLMTASFNIRMFLKQKEIDDNWNEQNEEMYIAIFKRGIDDKISRRIDFERSFMNKEGKIVSNLALTTGIRIIKEKDFNKSFRTLFISLNDTDVPKKINVENLSLCDIIIVNIGRLMREVERGISYIKSKNK